MARLDTASDAEDVEAAWRKMDGLQRIRVAESMSDDARRVARGGIKARRPGLSEAEVTIELIRLMYGVDLAAHGTHSEV